MFVLGDKIRIRRAELNITQQELANRSELSRITINSIEKGETKSPSYKTVQKIAKGLQITTEDLLSFGKDETLTYPEFQRGSKEVSEDDAEYYVDMTRGLKELIADKVAMRMMSVTEEEIDWMKTIRFRGVNPTKETYINMLFEYRKLGEK